MIKLLHRVSLSARSIGEHSPRQRAGSNARVTVAGCALFAALVGACGDSGPTDQNQTAATASGGSVSTPAAAGHTAPAATSGTGPSAGAAGQRPSTAATPQPAAAGSAGAATAGTPTQPVAGGSTVPAAAGTSGSAGATSSAGAMAAAGASGSAGGAAAATGDCDRACLLDMMQKYLDAVIAHDPTKVPISPMVKMTDNGATAKPGDGLWKTATMLMADARLDYADPMTKNVGTQCLMNEGSAPAMYEVRLKVEAGQITEIETMTVRRQGAANGFFSPMNLKPEAVFAKVPEASERMTRDQLKTTMELYLDYLEGKKSGRDVPFDAMCKRYENGVATASGLSSFQSQSWSFEVTRRILIIDEQSQIVWGMFPFYQSATTLVVGEAFKMLGGKFMMIQAIMANMPAKAWD